MKYFSLLTVIFLSVSSSEILCLLSFHNEIHSFSFVVTKPVISRSLLQRPLHYNIGSGVVMKVTILSPKLCKTPWAVTLSQEAVQRLPDKGLHALVSGAWVQLMVNWQSSFGSRAFFSLPDAGAARFLPWPVHGYLQIDFLTEPWFQWCPWSTNSGLSPAGRGGAFVTLLPVPAQPLSPRLYAALLKYKETGQWESVFKGEFDLKTPPHLRPHLKCNTRYYFIMFASVDCVLEGKK